MFAALVVTGGVPGGVPGGADLGRVERLQAVAADMTPRWEQVTPDAVVLDVQGLRRLCGGPEGIAEATRRLAASQGLEVHVAMAASWGVALTCASWAGAPQAYVPAGQEGAALAALPLEALGVWAGLRGPLDARGWRDLCATWQRWGLRTCGALAALPADEVHARLGALGVWVQQRARGHDPRPLRTQPPAEVFEQALTLEWPIDGLEPLSFVLPRVLDPLCAHLEARDRAAIVVRLALRLTDKQTHLRVIELPAPVRDARVLRTLLLLDLEAHPPAAGIDVLTVQVDPAPGRITQHSLVRRAVPSDDDRVALLARLTALMGEGRCGAPALVDSHRPGAVAMQPFEPDDLVTWLPGGPSPAHADARRLGPVPLVAAGRARAEAREPALEGWLDTAGYHLRRLRRPWPIEVTTTPGGARPVTVRVGARGWSDGAIATASGPWRSSGDWWHPPETWDRDEWDVALRDGTTYRVYQDRHTRQWWLEGEVD